MKITVFIAGLILVGSLVFAADMSINPVNMGIKDIPKDSIPKDMPLDPSKLTPPQNLTDSASNNQDISQKVKSLVNKLGSTSTSTDQSFAKNQLIKLDKQAVPYLNDSIKNDKRTFTRIQIADVLGKIKDESSVPALAHSAKSPYPVLNKAAVKNLGEIGGPKAASALEQLKGVTKDKDVMKEIQNALAKIKK